jgi:hypothetical protein
MPFEDLKRALGPAAFDDLYRGIVCEAEHDADVLADALGRQARAAKPSQGTGEALKPELRSVLALLALPPKVQRWHDGKYIQDFDQLPPDPAVVRGLLKRLSDGSYDDASVALCRTLAVRALVWWMENCSWSARRTIGTEIVLGNPSAAMAQVDDVADYLQTHHRIVTGEKGGNHADSSKE